MVHTTFLVSAADTILAFVFTDLTMAYPCSFFMGAGVVPTQKGPTTTDIGNAYAFGTGITGGGSSGSSHLYNGPVC